MRAVLSHALQLVELQLDVAVAQSATELVTFDRILA
jgi:hypothetical protein